MAQTQLPITVKGHVLIKDDLGNILLDKDNAVHPQNMARVIARALARESNYFINRIAFGNGGTTVDAAYQITYKTPNDGQAPDTAGWKSELYNETYSEIIDDSNPNIGSGPGADPAMDPTVTLTSGPGVRSTDQGLTSQVVITCVLNENEPSGQYSTDQVGVPGSSTENTESTFMFDEIGLYTTGAPHSATSGYLDLDVGSKTTNDDTGLNPSNTYTLFIQVDGGATQSISITTPAAGSGSAGQILYKDLVALLNAQLTGCVASISDDLQVNTFGNLRFTSNSVASATQVSSVRLDTANAGTTQSNYLLKTLNNYTQTLPPVDGVVAGTANDISNSANEGERMLTHIIFSPVLKAANRTLTIVYTLTVSVARTVVIG